MYSDMSVVVAFAGCLYKLEIVGSTSVYIALCKIFFTIFVHYNRRMCTCREN